MRPSSTNTVAASRNGSNSKAHLKPAAHNALCAAALLVHHRRAEGGWTGLGCLLNATRRRRQFSETRPPVAIHDVTSGAAKVPALENPREHLRKSKGAPYDCWSSYFTAIDVRIEALLRAIRALLQTHSRLNSPARKVSDTPIMYETFPHGPQDIL